MKLTLIRDEFTANSTTGRLLVDGKFECFVLEDRERAKGEKKVYGKTAIPRGTYKVEITQSARFKRLLPLLLNVPNFEGIRIHPGNKAVDTEGCLLPGKLRGIDQVMESRAAFNRLFSKLTKAKHEGQEIIIEIIGG